MKITATKLTKKLFIIYTFLHSFQSHVIAHTGEPHPELVKYYVKLMDGKKFLDLSEKNIQDWQVKALGKALEDNKTMTSLSLNHNKIGPVGAKSIGESLRVNKTLKYLKLEYNQIGDEGAKVLAEALKVNETLTSLYLSNNQIGDEGVKILAEALKVNETLTWLVLGNTASIIGFQLPVKIGYNQIGSEGAEALKVNKTLTLLNLEDNKIGVEGTKALAEALKVNKTLIFLIINAEGAKESEEIHRQLKFNSRLQGILRVNWPKVKQLFIVLGYNDAGSVFSTLPKEVILKIIGTVLDLETLFAENDRV